MLALALTLVPLQRASAQNMTWIVHPGGGFGVHFTDLPPAVLAASPGDVLLVHGGTYSPFLLDKGITILALVPGTVVVSNSGSGIQGLPEDSSLEPTLIIQDLPADQTAVLSGIRAHGIRVDDCAGAVLFDQLTDNTAVALSAPCLRILDCLDVRLARSPIQTAPATSTLEVPVVIRVEGSRLELSSSSVTGGKGLSCEQNASKWASQGTHGIFAQQGSRIHISRSSILGGEGGHGDPNSGSCWSCLWESGGLALGLSDASVAIAAGLTSDKFQTGANGTGFCPAGGGVTGAAVVLMTGAVFRHSGLSVVNGVYNGGGTQFSPSPPDPTLEFVGTPHPGMPVTLRIYGKPGAACSLDMGRKPIVQATPFTEVEILVEALATLHLGDIPASGMLDFVFNVPNLTLGSLLVAQANLAYSPVDRRRTNSALLVVQ
ncbi:MAG TPA: hypothetical protein VMS76_14300 [Planctomycetota bacterium]|nr:hypothetical protein [Planctomycetota bacterium]